MTDKKRTRDTTNERHPDVTRDFLSSQLGVEVQGFFVIGVSGNGLVAFGSNMAPMLSYGTLEYVQKKIMKNLEVEGTAP